MSIEPLLSEERSDKLKFIVQLSRNFPSTMSKLNANDLMKLDCNGLRSLIRYIPENANNIDELIELIRILGKTAGKRYYGDLSSYDLTRDALWAYEFFKNHPNKFAVLEVISNQDTVHHQYWEILRDHLQQYPETANDIGLLSRLNGAGINSLGKTLGQIKRYHEASKERAKEQDVQKLADQVSRSNPSLRKFIKDLFS